MSEMLLERMVVASDYDALYRLHVDSMRAYVAATYGWEDAAQERFFREAWDQKKEARVLVDGDDIVATWLIERRTSDVYLAFVEVASTHQSRGIGTRILRALLQLAEAARVPATLMVMKANPRARRLYERLGFVAVRETATHYEMSTRTS
jgi:ribosomal protein S18 acetylase RimI-like enzyme